MAKINLGAKNCLFPSLTTLVGANVGGAPNYITIAYVGIMDHGSISLSMNKVHYTNAGIKENGTFSVNIPSVEMVIKTDYFGLVSGKRVDKAKLVQTFYGELETAPMIEQCPINMECRLRQTVDFPKHDVFIGEIVATCCDESVLTDGAPFGQTHGEALATSTAWFDPHAPAPSPGRVHWVAVVPGAQRRGLGSALVWQTCQRLAELGHVGAYLTTGAENLPAISLYLRMNFAPQPRSDQERAAWRDIVAAISNRAKPTL